MPVTAGNTLIILALSTYAGGSTITDDQSNPWVNDDLIFYDTTGYFCKVHVSYVHNVAGGSTTISDAGSNRWGFHVLEVSGLDPASGSVASANNTTGVGSDDPFYTGDVITSGLASLFAIIFKAFGAGAGATGVASPWTFQQGVTGSGDDPRCSVAYLLDQAAGTYNAGFTPFYDNRDYTGAAAFAFANLVDTTTIRPIADVSDGGWLNEADSATDLYASIDDNPADNGTWIKPPRGSTTAARFALGDPGGTPGTGDWTLRVIAKHINA